MSNDLISRSAVIAIIEKKRLLVGKHDLSAEYKLAGVQEEIENLSVCDIDKNLGALEDYLFEKYCVEGDSKIDEIVKAGLNQ